MIEPILDREEPAASMSPPVNQSGTVSPATPRAHCMGNPTPTKFPEGPGNYGALGIGVYNGQGVSKAEANNNMHFVLRLETPWKMDDGQIMEAGVQAYTGTYSPYVTPIAFDNQKVTPVVVPEAVFSINVSQPRSSAIPNPSASPPSGPLGTVRSSRT